MKKIILLIVIFLCFLTFALRLPLLYAPFAAAYGLIFVLCDALFLNIKRLILRE